jgi:large subunit ribosomal protein L18e
MRKTGPTNQNTVALIQELRRSSQQAALWKRVAEDIAKSTRSRRVVNVSRIARHTKPDETIIVPGKVLGSGAIPHKVTVAALSFSDSARKQIENAKGKAITIQELLRQKVEAKNIKIIG